MPPSSVNAYANILGETGYSIHAREFFKALDNHLPVCLVPKTLDASLLKDPHLEKMIRRLLQIDLHAPSICLDYPDEMYRFGGEPRIGYTVFETQKIGSAGIHQLRQMSQVWVPSQWGKQVLIQNGIQDSQITVIPEGVNTRIFRPELQGFEQIQQRGKFRFLTVSKWEERKGVRELLHAFDQAFNPEERVYLIALFSTNVNALKNVHISREIDKLNLRNRNKILTIDSSLGSAEEMARLYNSCHAFISASKAEGWGLPIMEAMACGLPVIAPFYSGPTEYLTEKNSFPLPVKQFEDVYCPYFFPEKGAYGTWAHIDKKDLSTHMRRIYENPVFAKEIGRRAADEMRRAWSWEHAADKAQQSLEQLTKTPPAILNLSA